MVSQGPIWIFINQEQVIRYTSKWGFKSMYNFIDQYAVVLFIPMTNYCRVTGVDRYTELQVTWSLNRSVPRHKQGQNLTWMEAIFYIGSKPRRWNDQFVYCKQTTNHQGSLLFRSLPSLIRGPHRRNLFLGDTLLSKGCLIGRISDRTCLDAKISHMKIVSGVNSPWQLGTVRNSSYNPKFQSAICWVNSNLMIVIQKECFYQCSREINSRSSEFGILLSTWSLGSVLNSPDMKKFVFPIKQTLTVDGDANRSNINRSFA